MNIGGGSGSYNNIPMFWEMESAREFTNFIRQEMFNILLYSHDNYGLKSNCWIGLHIHEDIDNVNFYEWDFIIKCKNIREFKLFHRMTRDQWDAMKIERIRSKKLEDILND